MSTSALTQTLADIASGLRECLEDLQEAAHLGPNSVLVVGASSSEILGERIGTHTSLEIGRVVVEEVRSFASANGIHAAFQCCEHLNRAIVVSRHLAEQRGFSQVAALPVPGAGGAVAANAYLSLGQDACLVESISADAGIDIGDTFIGMHLKRVAVPVRGRRQEIGHAHVTLARTRPPLIGGGRAIYDEATFRARLGVGGDGAVDAAGGGDVGGNVRSDASGGGSDDCM